MVIRCRGKILRNTADEYFYFLLKKYFYRPLLFYFYLSKKIANYLNFYLSTPAQYFVEHCVLEVFQTVCKSYLNVTDRQTDDMQSHNRALRSIAW